MREPLVLDLGHVDVRGALRLAGLAGQAKVEHAVHAFRGELFRRQDAGEGGAQGIRPPASRVLLVHRGVVGGAHGPGHALAANPRAVAHLDRAGEAPLGREIELGLDRLGPVVGPPAQVLGQIGRIDDLAGVEDVLRIQRKLQLEEAPVDRIPEQPLVVAAAGNAIPVFAGHRASVIHHDEEDLVGDLRHLADFGWTLEIDHRTHVQAPDRGMPVVPAVRVVPLQYVAKLPQEPPHLFDRHGGVLHEGDRLVVALDRHQDSESFLPHVPDLGLLRGIGDRQVAVTRAGRLERSPQVIQLGNDFGLALAVVLDDHHGLRIAFDPIEFRLE